ncbi:MAG TPA: hypothetical protein VK869_01130 [Rubrobacteraceae bacterium]|nr:hypothetical protein [Rubrobacteraceae bacterium]
MILLILIHVGLVYVGIDRGVNAVSDAIYSLGELLESPAVVLLNAVSTTGQIGQYAENFYVIALTAAAGYFIIYLLLGVGRR